MLGAKSLVHGATDEKRIFTGHSPGFRESKALIRGVELVITELATILKKQEVELLLSTRELLDEILETLEMSKDPSISKAIKEGVRDMKSGKVRPYRDFVRELRGSHEL